MLIENMAPFFVIYISGCAYIIQSARVLRVQGRCRHKAPLCKEDFVIPLNIFIY